MTDNPMPGDPVAVPLPPNLPLTLGYTGDARYVGFFWSPLGDQLVATDGINSGTANSWGFLAYKRHPAVRGHLADYDLGSSKEDAAHMLLLDREHQTATVALVSEARAFLESQWPEQAPMTPEQEELFRAELARLLEEQRTGARALALARA